MSPGDVLESRPAFVPAYRLKEFGYERQCPIARVWRTTVVQEDGGTFAFGDFDGFVIPVDDVLADDPGFLVLHLATLDDDPIVDSAATSLHASIQSLMATCGSDVPVHYEKIRTALEVRLFMEAHRWLYSHVILVGHGGTDGIRFIDTEMPLARSEFAQLLGCDVDCRNMQVISLCCHSGCEQMAAALSLDPSVSEVVAPDGAFDVRWSTVFVIGYLLRVFDEGDSPESAVRAVRFGQPLCVWRKGVRHACDAPDDSDHSSGAEHSPTPAS